MRALTAISSVALALCGCGGMIFEPDRRIASFEAEANGRETLLLLKGLATQHGLELKGGLFLPPMKAAAPPVDEATIHAGDCMIVAEMRGSRLELSLYTREQRTCPGKMHAFFEGARRRFAPDAEATAASLRTPPSHPPRTFARAVRSRPIADVDARGRRRPLAEGRG